MSNPVVVEHEEGCSLVEFQYNKYQVVSAMGLINQHCDKILEISSWVLKDVLYQVTLQLSCLPQLVHHGSGPAYSHIRLQNLEEILLFSAEFHHL